MSAKRNSHASDTSSAYSGSDVLQSSLEDQDIDFTGLVESLVDSDDEEGYIDNNEVGCVCICIYLLLKSHNEENCEQPCFFKYIFAKYALWLTISTANIISIFLLFSYFCQTLLVRDTVRECLEKDAAERTEDDIETLLEFMQHLPVS